jgi:amidase
MLSALSTLSSSSVPPIAEILNINSTLQPVNVSQNLDAPFPYYFPNQDEAGTPVLFPMPPCHGITLEEATIDQLQDYMNQGVLTSVQLAMCYLERYWQTNGYIKYVRTSKYQTVELFFFIIFGSIIFICIIVPSLLGQKRKFIPTTH